MPSFVAADTDADISQHRENQMQDASPVAQQDRSVSKKEQGVKPCEK
jgi:hypothetical protein